MKKVGIMAGRERSFPDAFVNQVNERNAGVTAEWVKLGAATSLEGPNPYAVIVDRISHEVPYYQLFLKYAQLQGTYVINNPFARMVEDKFTANLIAQRQDVAVPKSLILPNKEYIPDISSASLSNLIHPLDWQEIADYIGFPAVLKPAVGGGWKSVSIVHSVEEMIRAYDASGQLSLIVQEFIAWDRYLRCICIGRERVLPIAWDPTLPFHERYLRDPNYLSAELSQQVVEDALKLCRGLGHDMNTVEFAIRDDVPIAIDFTNSAPDFDIASLGEWHFNSVLDAMTDLVIKKANTVSGTGSSYAEGFAANH